MSVFGFSVHAYESAEGVAINSNLIVTATPSREALLKPQWVQDGTHITAAGADGPGKQELDAWIVGRGRRCGRFDRAM
ncbi:hypothetical protein [Paraburkholderia sp. BL27I4N3]|uniref:hypothetical protein n=1 Tax=Paraburkholderia sp. BL27I4N3 TaxID=1938805 RepID=UPI0038573271